MKRDYVNENDWQPEEIGVLLDLAGRVKKDPGRFRSRLEGKTLAMIFEKSSTRTRVSFEAGMFQLGGLAMFLSSRDLQLGRGETVADTARVLSRYADGIMARTYAHATVEDLARWSTVPVINGLSDLLHPCQALADFLTVRERFGTERGFPLCYVGDGNNVAHSLLLTGAKLGARVAVVTPPGFEPPAQVLAWAREAAFDTGGSVLVTHSLEEGLRGRSCGLHGRLGVDGPGGAKRRTGRRSSRHTASLPKSSRWPRPTRSSCTACPLIAGRKWMAAVIDSPASAVFDQAENRLHAQKALLLTLLSEAEGGPL